ncbi:MAG TPA: hypothetical protein VGN72_17170 [Tepidisphaeraceae bacterium]|nr:hypothetical protein [Tepidisphaeraceae bacterium]
MSLKSATATADAFALVDLTNHEVGFCNNAATCRCPALFVVTPAIVDADQHQWTQIRRLGDRLKAALRSAWQAVMMRRKE